MKTAVRKAVPEQPKHCQPKHCQPKHCQPKHCQPKHCQPKHCQPKHCQPKHCEPKHCEPTIASEARCELCHGNQFEPIAHHDRLGQPLETVVCRRCGLVSHAQIPDEDTLRRYYSDRYRAEYNSERTPSDYRVLREWRRGQELLGKLRAHLPTGGRVFEIGSGIGCTVKQFELAGYESRGVEPGKGFYSFSRERLKTAVQLGVLEDIAIRGTEDLVLLVHVLEHLPHPRQALQRIHGLLKPGGLLYVEVPNFGLPHAAPGRIFHFAHIYNFTQATLTGLARSAGFETVEAFPTTCGKNLTMLFRATDTPSACEVDASGYATAVDAVRRHRGVRYYLRPCYVFGRARDLSCRFVERLTARRQARRIAELCNPSASAPVNSTHDVQDGHVIKLGPRHPVPQ